MLSKCTELEDMIDFAVGTELVVGWKCGTASNIRVNAGEE